MLTTLVMLAAPVAYYKPGLTYAYLEPYKIKC